jgi:hypothetical protein
MIITGNVMTGIRECQAIMSLGMINRSMQNIILKGIHLTSSLGSNIISHTAAPTTATTLTDGVDVKLNSITNSSKGMIIHSDGLSGIDHRCPDTIPLALWTSLSRVYNYSQLKAIQAAAMRCKVVEGDIASKGGVGAGAIRSSNTGAGAISHPTLTLLQGNTVIIIIIIIIIIFIINITKIVIIIINLTNTDSFICAFIIFQYSKQSSFIASLSPPSL